MDRADIGTQGLRDQGTRDHGLLTTDLFRAPAGLLVGILPLYGLGVLMASIATAARSEWKLLPVLPLVFGCYHFGYGWGFLRGIIDFMLLKRGPRDSFARLTRPAEPRPHSE
jgi:hypothetical protein